MEARSVQPLRWREKLAVARPHVGVAPAPEEELSSDQEQSAVRLAVAMVDLERRARREAEERNERLAALVAKERQARIAAERRASAAEREARALATELLGNQGPAPAQRKRRSRVRSALGR